ncbi:MAG: hypothetical protein R3B84_12590 [Zavarzinella sp.]
MPYLVENIVTPEHQNQSLPGLLTRLLSHAPSFSTYDQNNVYIPLAYHNFVTWDALTIKRIVQVCQFLFVALLIWTSPWGWRRPMPVLPNWRIAAEFFSYYAWDANFQ